MEPAFLLPVSDRSLERNAWDSRKAWYAYGLLLAVFLVLAFWGFGESFGRNQYDDAYITYRYAANLAEGKGYAFNPGERWNAASSPLYTVLLAACFRLGFTNLELAGSLIGLVSGGLVLAASWVLVLRWTRRPGLGWLCLLPLALNGQMAAWAVSGMEAVLFSALVMGALLRLDQGAGDGELACWLGLATLCRLEGLALAPALALGVWLRDRRPARGARVLILGLAPLGAWLLFSRVYFGETLPQSLIFKNYCLYYKWSPAVLGNLLLWMSRTQLVALLGFFMGLVGAVAHPKTGRPAWIALLMCSCLGLVEVLLGPNSDFQRYYLFLLPMTLLATAVFIGQIWERWRPWGAVVSLGLLLVLAAQSAGSERDHQLFFTKLTGQAQSEEAGEWLDRNAGPGDSVLSVNLGAIAWRARRLRFIDGSGLCTPPVLDLVRAGDMDLMVAIQRLRPSFVVDGLSGNVPVPLKLLSVPGKCFAYPPGSRPRLPLPRYRFRVIAVSKVGVAIVALDWGPLEHL
jgi:hypothetical protein